MSIFERVKDFIQPKAPLATDTGGVFPFDVDLWVATVVLLLEMAYGDGEYVPKERKAIRLGIKRAFGISRGEAALLMEGAESSRQGGDLAWVSTQLRERYDLEQRKCVIALLWKTVYADRVVTETEEGFADYVAQLAGLTRAQGNEAREMAEQGRI